MEWTSAWLLLRSNGPEERFLLAQERRTGEWSALGGLRELYDSPTATAAKEALIQTRSAVGSLEDIRANTIERVTCGSYHTFICQFPFGNMASVIGEFNRSSCTHPRSNEIRQLAWVRVRDVYEAIAKASPATPNTVKADGKWLQARLVVALRRSYEYQRFVRDHNPKRRLHSGDIRVREVTATLRNTESTTRLVPLVVLEKGLGRVKKAFAVLQNAGPPDQMSLQECPDLCPDKSQGLLAKVSGLWRWQLDSHVSEPTIEERQAVWLALKNRSWWKRGMARILDWRLRIGAVSKSTIARLQNPL